MTGFRQLISTVLLVGCTGVQGLSDQGDIALTKLPMGRRPSARAGVCWASDTTPAVIETVTEHLQIRPERRDTTGAVTSAAEFETKTAQRLVQDREIVWFRAPCADEVTVNFIASLQRALKARGRYNAAVTGVYDAATGEAVRALQAERGLDSPFLALETARQLGLAASVIK